MIGYLNLTTIIDRIIADPLYGASTFGDIKELMTKMIEMCSYEKILFTKTSVLVSNEVFVSMAAFKRLSCKSYSVLTDFCNMCSRSLDMNSDTTSLTNSTSYNDETGDITKTNVCIFYCGHSFHQSCIESRTCPICNVSTNNNGQSNILSPKISRLKQKMKNKKLSPNSMDILDFDEANRAKSSKTFERINSNSSVSSLSNSLNQEKFSPSAKSLNEDEKSIERELNQAENNIITRAPFISSLTREQISTLKSIRKRNQSLFKVNLDRDFNYSNQQQYDVFNTNLEKQSKLNLAPANLKKFLNSF